MHNEKTLGEALKQMLKAIRLDDKMVTRRIEHIWPNILGKGPARFTNRLYFTKGKLYVNVTSAAFRSELTMNKNKLMTQINSRLPKDCVKEIIIIHKN